MQRLRRILIALGSFLALPMLVAGFGLHEYWAQGHPDLRAAAGPEVLRAARRPTLDPAKPTVVVLLGADLTEVTDALGPYEVFARAGAFNVLTAAPERRPTLLTGGLTVLPHYALSDLDTLLGNGAADVVVVPNIPNIAEPQNEALVGWLQEQAASGALMHSWCKGAMALAEAGLLDGSTATAHWGDIPELERQYPAVTWQRGVRWVEHGRFVMSAGITSGIDASLRVITRLLGDATARRVAGEMRYPNFQYSVDPAAPPYTIEPADAILLADAAFGGLRRSDIGLAVYPGVGELDLSNIYDAHAYTMVATVHAVGDQAVIHTAHGLTVLPSVMVQAQGDAKIRDLDRLVIPGPDAEIKAAAIARLVATLAPGLAVEYVHAREPSRFGLEPVLEDLAVSSDVATARFALRRMEYRSSDVRLRGSSLDWRIIALPLALGLLGLSASLLWSTLATKRRTPPRVDEKWGRESPIRT